LVAAYSIIDNHCPVGATGGFINVAHNRVGYGWHRPLRLPAIARWCFGLKMRLMTVFINLLHPKMLAGPANNICIFVVLAYLFSVQDEIRDFSREVDGWIGVF